MGLSEHQAYIRGEANLRAKDFVDTGLVRDTLVNNANHLFTQAHPTIVNTVTTAGSSDQIKPLAPVVDEYSLVVAWPFRALVGPETRLYYRMRVFRSGGSGNVEWLFRVTPATANSFEPTDPAAAASPHHFTTAATSPTILTKSIDLSAPLLRGWTPSVTPEGVQWLQGNLEAWAKITASGSSPRISSAYARLFAKGG